MKKKTFIQKSDRKEELKNEHPLIGDSIENINFDNTSKYAFEKIEDENEIPVHELYDMLDTLKLSTIHTFY